MHCIVYLVYPNKYVYVPLALKLAQLSYAYSISSKTQHLYCSTPIIIMDYTFQFLAKVVIHCIYMYQYAINGNRMHD